MSTEKNQVNKLTDKTSDLIVRPVDKTLLIRPLGGGKEIGRSCVFLKYKEKQILLDCGIHPGKTGINSLPFVDLIEISEIDVILISHFHLDHCGALPWLLQKSNFKGRCFMTEATKAIYQILLTDYIKDSHLRLQCPLFSESDVEASIAKIETIRFHEETYISGISICAYHAGHALGAAMFMIEIAGVRVLYTGDFSRQEGRHFMAAEIPRNRPDVLITEATYGIKIHENRDVRDSRFKTIVKKIVSRGGRCLIPVFPLDRAQELLLILDEYWSNNPELHTFPIYYVSGLATKCIAVYQTYVNAMNDSVHRKVAVDNPFIFKHIQCIKDVEDFKDAGPCVVVASPGMLQAGPSRILFELWYSNPKNGIIIPGYCCEGTLAQTILSEPEEIKTKLGTTEPLNMSVDYISFSSHTDYEQTSNFIQLLKPTHIMLVQGEENEIIRLKTSLAQTYTFIKLYTPRNNEAIKLYFYREKRASIRGCLTIKNPEQGILVEQVINYQIMFVDELPNFTDICASSSIQRQTIFYTGSLNALKDIINTLAYHVDTIDGDRNLREFGAIDIELKDNLITLQWMANAVNNLLANAVVKAILHVKTVGIDAIDIVSSNSQIDDHMHYKNCLVATLQDMFGKDSLPEDLTGDIFNVTVNGKTAIVNLGDLNVTCNNDEVFQRCVQNAVTNLYYSLMPPRFK